MSKSVDVSNWTRDYSDNRHPFWWGIMILIAIELTVVAGFIASFFYTWISQENVLPGEWIGDKYPPLAYPTWNTFLVSLCALSMYYGGIVMQKGKQWHFFWSVVFCCVVGLVVLYLRWLQFQVLPFSWKDSAYASFVWTLTGFHFVHITSAILGTLVIGWFSYKGYYTVERRIGIQVDTLYWYFVFFAWIPIYTVIYWIPRLVR